MARRRSACIMAAASSLQFGTSYICLRISLREKIMKPLLYILAILLLTHSVDALEVRFYPEKSLYLNDANPRYGTYDVVAHLILVKNDSKEKVVLEKLDLALYADQQILQQVHLNPENLVNATKELLELKQQGMEIIADVIVPSAAMGKDGKLASTAELQPGEILTARNIYLTAQGIPTHLRANAAASNAAGKRTDGSGEIKIIRYKSPNNYSYPLEGVWYMQAVPNVTSHHRWMYQTEFGIDFMKVDAKGGLSESDGKSAVDFYGYGEPVLAAADGVIVKTINDAVQNWDAWLQREGESEEEFEKRSTLYQLDMMKQDLYKAVTGNLVVIEHSGGEYSAYAHLKQGSVLVKPGDRVKQGQRIGEVGDTGDYYMAHLHFQVSDQPDVLRGRSLPFEFVNLGRRPELGYFARLRR